MFFNEGINCSLNEIDSIGGTLNSVKRKRRAKLRQEDLQLDSVKTEKIDLHGVLGVDHRDESRVSRIDEKQSIEEQNDHQPMRHQRGDPNEVRQEFATNSRDVDQTGHCCRWMIIGSGSIANDGVDQMIEKNERIEEGHFQEEILQGSFLSFERMSKNVDVDNDDQSVAQQTEKTEGHRDQERVELNALNVFMGSEGRLIVVDPCPVHLVCRQVIGGMLLVVIQEALISFALLMRSTGWTGRKRIRRSNSISMLESERNRSLDVEGDYSARSSL